MRRLIPLLLFVSLLAGLGAQSNLVLSGVNEASFTYRTVPDSLNAYFRNAFSFGLGYRNFSFGMKFVAELPKYSTSQSELLDDLVSDRLDLGWRELYASYTKGAYLIHAGTIEESFGSGMTFRSFEDLEFDADNRVTGFKFGYDDLLRIKALYSGIASISNPDKLDLAYGLDAEYPVLSILSLGATALAQRNLTAFGNYSQSDVFGGRAKFQTGAFEASVEYARRELYRRGMDLPGISGSGLYGTLSLNFGAVTAGGAYKRYDQFQYRLQDLPLANHHNETLADNQGSGTDEEGFQGWAYIALPAGFNLNLDYAEAWNDAQDMRMNDAYAGLEYTGGSIAAAMSWNHIEKVDDALSKWQKEYYPAFNLSFPAWGRNLVLSGEFKTIEKQDQALESRHYEPKLQADIGLGKLGVSLGMQSWWHDFSSLTDSRYWTNMEIKYPILADTELLLFAGTEAGGKVCRNGVCRYVAPFSGLRLELNTRF
ncbi:MAG TPA: DUF6029 family protein [Candidatus Syntrophosphaera sp.]|nr:DUF6029 family protein [Candidatus Syntrophosphaera sp.]